jgi:hypothetical protein
MLSYNQCLGWDYDKHRDDENKISNEREVDNNRKINIKLELARLGYKVSCVKK